MRFVFSRMPQAAAGALACGMLWALSSAGSVAVAQDADQLEQGKQLFLQDTVPTCATCHTLADAGATGPVGPDLDDLQPDRDQVLAALRDGPGAMPSFADGLNEEQMEALAAYVVAAASGH